MSSFMGNTMIATGTLLLLAASLVAATACVVKYIDKKEKQSILAQRAKERKEKRDRLLRRPERTTLKAETVFIIHRGKPMKFRHRVDAIMYADKTEYTHRYGLKPYGSKRYWRVDRANNCQWGPWRRSAKDALMAIYDDYMEIMEEKMKQYEEYRANYREFLLSTISPQAGGEE